MGWRLAEAAIKAAGQRHRTDRAAGVSIYERAIALYRGLRFVEGGVRRRSLKLDGRYDDTVLMAFELPTGKGASPVLQIDLAPLCTSTEGVCDHAALRN